MRAALTLFALAIGGQAAALFLVDVKRYSAYQHYKPWPELLSSGSPAPWIFLAYVVVVGAAAYRWRGRLQAMLTGVMPRWTVLCLAGGTLASLAVPTASAVHAAGDLLLAALVCVVAALTLLLGVIAIPDEPLRRLTSWIDARLTLGFGGAGDRPWDRRLPLVIAGWVVLAAVVANVIVLERLPHIDDSVSNLFQAKYFSTGRLYLPPPPDIESFRVDLLIVKDGKWFAYAFPGWPAVLAVGVAAGVPWLVNPILGGLLILISHAWLRRRWDRGTANLALLLLVPSPWLIFMSAEFMGHPLTALLIVIALLALDRAREGRGRPGWTVLAGAAAGAVMLTRSFDGVLFVCALGIMAAIDGGLTRAWRPLLGAAIVAGLVGALNLPYNLAVTGRATYPAHEVWGDTRYGPGVDVIGFGPNVGIDRWPHLDPLPGHGPADVVLNLNKNLFMTNADLFGWAIGSLTFVWLAVGFGGWTRRDAPLLILPATYMAGYSLFWFSGGPDLGARYWYPLLIPLAALSARGIARFADSLVRRGAMAHMRARVAVAVLVASIGAVATTLPWRAVSKYYRYRGVSGEVRALAESAGIHQALVFVRVEDPADYQSAFSLNPRSFVESATIYALDAGPVHRAVVTGQFQGRPVWVIGPAAAAGAAGPRRWRVLERPSPAGSVGK